MYYEAKWDKEAWYSIDQIIPTRMEYSRIKDKLAVARKGSQAFKIERRADASILIMVREDMELRGMSKGIKSG